MSWLPWWLRTSFTLHVEYGVRRWDIPFPPLGLMLIFLVPGLAGLCSG